jgi:hypothetical protein
MKITSRLLTVSAILLILVPAQLHAFLPSGLWILEKVAQNNAGVHGQFELEVTFPNGEKWLETWLVQDAQNIKWIVKSPRAEVFVGEFKQQKLVSAFDGTRSGTFFLPEFWFFQTNSQNLATALVNRKWASAGIFERRSPSEKEPITAESGFVRFGRANGVIAYHFSLLENQGIWIEQDRYLIRKISEQNNFEMNVLSFQNQKEKFIAKDYTISWITGNASIKLLNHNKKISTKIPTTFSYMSLVTADPVVMDFYKRFR